MTVYFRPYRDLTKAPTPRTAADTDLHELTSRKTGLAITIDPDVDCDD